jgi:hypothetical protein
VGLEVKITQLLMAVLEELILEQVFLEQQEGRADKALLALLDQMAVEEVERLDIPEMAEQVGNKARMEHLVLVVGLAVVVVVAELLDKLVRVAAA